MQHKDLGVMHCPIARGLERVGEWWSILIMRDAFQGLTRFDQFQKSLGIAPNMLTRRLTTLVESGLLERRLYSEKPERYEYVLTQRGRDFGPVLWALVVWGNKHFSPEGEIVTVVDAETGERADPLLIDSRSGRELRAPAFTVIPGPAANDQIRERHAWRAQIKRELEAASATQSAGSNIGDATTTARIPGTGHPTNAAESSATRQTSAAKLPPAAARMPAKPTRRKKAGTSS